MKILIVDDKTSIRKEMKKILNQLEFDDLTEAIDGNDAWFKLKAEFKGRPAETFDLIISDMEMPGMSGLELLEGVRNDAALKDTPFIMVTTVNTKDVILKTMKLGIQAYIIKPFNLKTVAAKLVQAGVLK